MRKIKIMEHISLDGVIQQSADDGDFPYSGWAAPYRTPAGLEAILAAYGEIFDLLLGRRTYDIWSGFWPKAPLANGAPVLIGCSVDEATTGYKTFLWTKKAGARLNYLQETFNQISERHPRRTCGSYRAESTLHRMAR
jgi:dihydrofolate reductase